jgi:glycerol-3-phosphate dehydrogenase subunit B
MRSANIARIFDNENTLNELADIISREMGDAEAGLLPAMLGVDGRDSVAKLEKKLWRKVAVIATLPPSVPGLQVQTLLLRYFQELGGVYLLGDTATGYKAAGDCIEAIYTHNHGDIALKADDYVLATGSYFSQGLVASNGAVREPLFGVDVAYDKVRSNWYERDMFTAQPYEKFGIITDENLKALRDGKKVDNLYAIGAGLAGFNPVKEGCGAGVSMLTAMSVADKILSKK